MKNNKDCRDAIALLEAGAARIQVTMIDGKRTMTLLSRSGAPQAIVDPKYTYQFTGWATAADAGDGLFPGFGQTTRLAG